MAKISAPTVGLGADAKVGCKEAGDHKEQTRPTGARRAGHGRRRGVERGDSRREEESDEGKGDLLGQVSLGLRPRMARSRRTEVGMSQLPPPLRVRASAAGRPSRAPTPPALTVRTEDTGWLGNSTQLGQRLGEGRLEAGRRPGPTEQQCRYRTPAPQSRAPITVAVLQMRSGVVSPGPLPLSLRVPRRDCWSSMRGPSGQARDASSGLRLADRPGFRRFLNGLC